ncbi:hypothetical protein TWF679_005693 [Orbilia oligospora]|uniref:MIOS-like alpha-solenoid domain-containing protein n=1 Tax=Orbilia oligospora TaxID=2813651 RepID=A0A8H8VB27_ORBOL|nr:hypothetical protein TWF679_005693 [Orbilia oligospora]
MNTVSDFIRWSPHSDTGAQQFMTISAKETHVSLYNVKDFNNKKPESIRSELVFKKEKIPHIKCFDWSPLGSDLVAVGKSGGEALILRMKSSENAENSISLPVKHQRGCNSVAFSRAGFLAIGLDKMGTQVATPVSTEGIGGVAAVARFKDPSKLEADRLNRESLFVTKVSETPFKRPLRYENTMTSFDWISDGSSDPDLRVISLARNGGITAFTVPTNPISTAFGARNNFVMTDNENATVLNAPSTKRIHVAEPNHTLTMGDDHTGYNDEDEDDDESDSSSTPEHPLTANGNGVGGRGEVNVRRDSVVNPEDYMFDPRDTLRIDISVTMRRRAEWGYQFDCAKNEKLVTKAKKENELAEMWRWLDGAMECTEGDGMCSGGLDLSYLGVLGIWRPNLPASRLDPGAKLDEKSFSAALKKINDCNGRKGRFKFAGDTKYPEQRILGLAMCGWDFNSDKDLEEALEKFEKKQQFEKAAGWALFHGNIERCIIALSMGKTEMKLMSTAVAGYNSHRMSAEKNGIAENTTWKDLCREMATHMDDPYSRAIFAYVSNGDWQDVLDGSTGLPIRERLGIALRFLEDDEVCNFTHNSGLA